MGCARHDDNAALEVAGDHIRVRSGHPGPIRTPVAAGVGDDAAGNPPIARIRTREGVEPLVVFLP